MAEAINVDKVMDLKGTPLPYAGGQSQQGD